jgi:hypothetical protein
MAPWIQEDTQGDYSQREYGKNILVVGDEGNGSGDAFQGDDAREDRVDLKEGRKEQLAMDDGGVDWRLCMPHLVKLDTRTLPTSCAFCGNSLQT